MFKINVQINIYYAGPIFLDGVDTCKIGLLELRRKISIVPQSPVIFSGTLRSNMDPFDKYSDASIWSALEKCNLKAMVAEFPEKLQHPVSEYGENFSQGQRQ
jgi:ABC-type multidrug transport system fused ATPase/permease subunit